MGNLGKTVNKVQDKVNNYMEKSSTGRTLQRIVRSDPAMGLVTGENPMDRWDTHTDWRYHTDSPLFNAYGKSEADANKYVPKEDPVKISYNNGAFMPETKPQSAVEKLQERYQNLLALKAYRAGRSQ